jgi:hypothetical protein
VLETGILVEDVEGYRLNGPLPPLAIPATLQDSLTWIRHHGENLYGDCGEKRPIHVDKLLSRQLPRVSALRHSHHERRYAASL